jgi:hypothetical protein
MKNERQPRDTCDTRDRRPASVTPVTSVTSQIRKCPGVVAVNGGFGRRNVPGQ